MPVRTYRDFLDLAIRANPIEAQILRRIFRALAAAGNPVVRVVTYNEKPEEVSTERDFLDAVFNRGACYLETADDSWVLFIVGNKWDAISDHLLGLEFVLAPVTAWIRNHLENEREEHHDHY
jgi:hypothetical protein